MLVGAYVRILYRGFTQPGSPRGNSGHPSRPYVYMVTLVCPALILRPSRGHLVTLVHLSPPPFVTPVIPALSDENSPRDTICPLPSSRSQDARARDIPSHENLIANPAETPGCKSFRELTSTVHENYARAERCSQARGNSRGRSFQHVKNFASISHNISTQ